MRLSIICGFAAVLLFGPTAFSQGDSPFGGFKHDRTAPIEITADKLEVRQSDQVVIFDGNVIAGQGTLRLTADRVEAEYDQNATDSSGSGAIRSMKADGNLFLSNGTETAQGSRGEYNVDAGTVQMVGNVILTQGQNAISGDRLLINLNTGKADVQGNVKVIFKPKSEGSESQSAGTN